MAIQQVLNAEDAKACGVVNEILPRAQLLPRARELADKIAALSLRRLMDESHDLMILDVRPKEARALDGTIPGAIAAHPLYWLSLATSIASIALQLPG